MSFILILERIDVVDFHGVEPPGKLMERIRAFRGRSPLFSLLVFSISTSLIFSRPNAKGRWPPSFSLRKSWLMSLKSGLQQWILFPLQFVTFHYLVLQQAFATFASLIPFIFLAF